MNTLFIKKEHFTRSDTQKKKYFKYILTKIKH